MPADWKGSYWKGSYMYIAIRSMEGKDRVLKVSRSLGL